MHLDPKYYLEARLQPILAIGTTSCQARLSKSPTPSLTMESTIHRTKRWFLNVRKYDYRIQNSLKSIITP